MPRRIIRAVVPTGLAAVLVLTFGPSALADDPSAPAYPGADQVRRARDEAGRKADGVARIEADLDREAADLAHLDIRVGAAVEAYNGAVVLRGRAQDEAARADGRLRTADLQLTRARDELGRIAAQEYRSGGGSRLGVFQALMDADSPGDAIARVETARRVANESDESVKRAVTVLRDAATAKTAAQHTAAAAERATEAVLAAKNRVEAELAAQRRTVVEIDARRVALLTELAAAKKTSVALESARRDGLAAEAQAKARAEAEEAEAKRQVRQTRDDAAAKTAAKPAEPSGNAPATASKPAAPNKNPPAETITADTDTDTDTDTGADAAIEYAQAQLGKPYIWGGEGPNGYDCSGLVMQAWRQAGVELTHFAAGQYFESTPVSYRDLIPGDLIFWTETSSPSDIHHVAMYLGDGKMIHAPRTGDVVKISDMFYMGTPDYYARPS